MGWEELDFDKAHVAYFILGGFTSLFMLCSLFIKERLYIGEATVATLVGLIFGPHAAGLFDPLSWGNTDKITLELSRIVLVVQCFAVGVELPKAYMERHWRSVFFLLVPVMTLGWLATGIIIFVCVYPLSWLESLAIAACVTATDPVLASSVVGKGKFAKRVPKHLRDILSAESGCNDGMAFPFIYLSYYLLRYHNDAHEVTFHWFVFIILYECIFGAVYGFIVGYIGRHAIKYAERHNLIDRDSFLVFYFVLALFCAGSAAGLGLDDLLVGFAAGVGFSNDGWFVEKTEESHVSNVIDLLLNLSYFVYLGAIIPWQDYNAPEIGLQPWRLVIISIAVILFRRIPALLLMKPLIPDVKNWREALFAGHFGPIGVGAIFAVILLRAELENESTEPSEILPGSDSEFYLLIRTSWPIVTFLVISSILVHGSSIAVFTLGKRINTLTLTMTYTTDAEQNWMERLPRIASRSKSMSISRNSKFSQDSSAEDDKDFVPGTLGPIGIPRNFLRRQKEDEAISTRSGTILSTKRPRHRRRRLSAGGPIDESAIAPVWRQKMDQEQERQEAAADEETSPDGVELDEKGEQELAHKGDSSDSSLPEIEAYQEGNHLIVEDAEGNVIDKREMEGKSTDQVREELMQDLEKLRRESTGEHALNRHHPHEKDEGEELEEAVVNDVKHPQQTWKKWLGQATKPGKEKEKGKEIEKKDAKGKPVRQHSGAAQAYQYGDKIIVEDADGEVLKTYDIPKTQNRQKPGAGQGQDGNVRRGLTRMGTWTFGGNRQDGAGAAADNVSPAATDRKPKDNAEDEDDKNVRFRVGGSDRRMSKQDFIKQIQSLDPKTRVDAVHQVDVPDDLKRDIKHHAQAESRLTEHGSSGNFLTRKFSRDDGPGPDIGNFLTRKLSRDDGAGSSGGAAGGASGGGLIGSMLSRRFSRGQQGGHSETLHVPTHKPPSTSSRSPRRSGSTKASTSRSSNASSHDYELSNSGKPIPRHDVASSVAAASAGGEETAAQRRRRLAAERARADSDSDDDGTERVPPAMRGRRKATSRTVDLDDEEETAAERKRRLAALGRTADEDSESEESDTNETTSRPLTPIGNGSGGRMKMSTQPASVSSEGHQSIEQPARAHVRDRAVGTGGTGGVVQSVVPDSPIVEEDDDELNEDNDNSERPRASGATRTASHNSTGSRGAGGRPSPLTISTSSNSNTTDSNGNGGGSSDTPLRSPPGIRFAEMPRGEGAGRSRRFGRTMGMKGRK